MNFNRHFLVQAFYFSRQRENIWMLEKGVAIHNTFRFSKKKLFKIWILDVARVGGEVLL